MNSLGIGILGEYIGRIYSKVKQRPLYVVEESVNIDGIATRMETATLDE